MRGRKGQSVLEYTLLITAVILAVVYGAKLIASKTTSQFDSADTMLNTANTKLQQSVQ